MRQRQISRKTDIAVICQRVRETDRGGDRDAALRHLSLISDVLSRVFFISPLSWWILIGRGTIIRENADITRSTECEWVGRGSDMRSSLHTNVHDDKVIRGTLIPWFARLVGLIDSSKSRRRNFRYRDKGYTDTLCKSNFSWKRSKNSCESTRETTNSFHSRCN